MSAEITSDSVPAKGTLGVPATSATASSNRGHLRVFLGMAAGVGKTYQMLLEGHAQQEAGRDVVIGLLETHGRADTGAGSAIATPCSRR
jgi:K+-sensing histidine kinase KdpD